MNLSNKFERAWPHLEPAVTKWRHHTRESVFESLSKNKAQLWSFPNSAVVTMIKNYPSGRRAFQFWLAGGELSEILSFADDAIKMAREYQCDEMCIVDGRRGWARVLGGREIGSYIVKELD